ncbi:SPW repeat protein [Mycobacterium hodleri]|uniref:SPW repeat domain-containing protein n=1 Tax=Mycolicibacterium hodleri TaxID=49897 RepID=UPI0021F2E3C3|nr:SPW repeat protein [Mycolicibacterium hodleri]MCV7132429.1 SPW repeat protein [Mycolicibacterium hodleri]
MSRGTWICWAAAAVGVCAVVAAFAASSTRVGEGFAFGFGAFIVFFGVLSVFAHTRAPDYWGLVVVGLAMFIVPFLGNGYAYDLGASWTCWVAGALAMILGGVGWTQEKAHTGDRINEIGDNQGLRSAWSFWIGRTALFVGLVTVLMGVALHSTAAGTAVTVGFGAMMAVIAVWSLLAVDPTHDFLTLAVVGLALFLSPWVGGFADSGSAWTAWVSGALTTALGVAGYLRGERLDFATVVRDDSAARYRKRFR